MTDGIGLTASTTQLVSVKVGNQAPIVDAGPDVSQVESSRYVNFSGTAQDLDGTIASYHWDFGDGEVSDLANPSHYYATKGSFVATLTAVDDQGLSTSDTTTVTITNEDPTINGLGLPTRVAPGVSRPVIAYATDYGIDTLTAAWDFGDGTPVTSVDPAIAFEHAWTNPGTYTVIATVTDGQGGTATASGTVVVTANTVSAGPDRSGAEGEELTFMRPLDGVQDSAAIITWDFGDGSALVSFVADDTAPVKHTYRNNGTYTLTLTSNDGSTTVTDTATVTISNVAPVVTGIAASSGGAPGSSMSLRVRQRRRPGRRADDHVGLR